MHSRQSQNAIDAHTKLQEVFQNAIDAARQRAIEEATNLQEETNGIALRYTCSSGTVPIQIKHSRRPQLYVLSRGTGIHMNLTTEETTNLQEEDIGALRHVISSGKTCTYMNL